jgi:RHS repeat-associated protein
MALDITGSTNVCNGVAYGYQANDSGGGILVGTYRWYINGTWQKFAGLSYQATLTIPSTGSNHTISVQFTPSVGSIENASLLVYSYFVGTISSSISTACPNQTFHVDLTNQFGSLFDWEKKIGTGNWTSTGTGLLVLYDQITTSTTYRMKLQTDCGIQYSNEVTVAVFSVLSPGSITQNQNICFNSSPSTLTSGAVATGGNGIYTYQWQVRPQSGSWSDLVGSTGLLYSPGVLTANTEYRRMVTSGCSFVAYSNSILITVFSQLLSGSIGGATAVCIGGAVDLTYSSPTGGDGVYSYQWQSSPDNSTWSSVSGANGADYNPTNIINSIYYRRQVSNCLESKFSNSVFIITNSPSVGGVVSLIQGSAENCESAVGTLSVSSYSGNVLKWQSQFGSTIQDIATTSYTLNYSISTAQTYTYWAVIQNGACTPVNSSTVQIIVYPTVPLTASGSTSLPYAGSVVLNTSSYLSYDWKKNSVSISGATLQTYLVTSPGDYRVRVQVSPTKYCTSNILKVKEAIQDQIVPINYVRVIDILKEGITPTSDFYDLGISSFAERTEYFDGLGRSIQSVSLGASSYVKDLVQYMEYDALGRESKRFIPHALSIRDGRYQINSNVTQASFYVSSNDKIADDTRPFSETIFEPSPLNRPSQEFGVGQNWKDNSRFIQHQYLINVNGTLANQEQLIAWKLDATGLPIRETTVNTAVSGGYYTTGQLQIKSTKDEQGNEVREYVDKEGRTILKKVQAVTTPVLNTAAHWTSTYYIYDDLGNLRYVLQPELSKTLLASATVNPTQTQLDNLAFQYKYDGRRRMTEKKVPGAGWVYMVYDLRDRLILTQDANQRAGAASAIKYWTFTKYDELNRPILTGIKDTTVVGATVLLTQAQMQGAVDAHFAKASSRWGETYVGNATGNMHGYTNNAYPVITGGTSTKDPDSYVSVTYYDNYTFRSLWVGSYTYLNESLSETTNGIAYAQPVTENLRVIGQVTGSKTKVLDGGTRGGYTWLKSVNYYDDKYRAVQNISDNYKGGTDRTTNVIDFVGKVLKTKSTHEERDVTWRDQTGVSVVGNKLTRTAATTAGAASVQVLGANQDGWLEFIMSERNLDRYIGFNDTNPDANATNIDYAFYLNGAALKVFENNVLKLTAPVILRSGDILRIARTGSTIKYYYNGGLLTYQNNAAISSPLMVDVSLQSTNATVVGVTSSFSTNSKNIIRRLIYDHAGRLMKTFHSLDGAAEILLTQNEYNEIGQLVDKKLHSTNSGTSFRQSVDYRYNIRGWLSSMNNSQLNVNAANNDETNDYFGMELGYNNSIGSGNSALFNGNISAMKWSKNLVLGAVKDVAYNYSYDPLNRILSASYLNNTSGAWANSTNAFSESGYAYDLNGNITNLTRKGATGATMDLLAYTYGTGTSQGNQLLKVGDTGDKTTGFMDGANTTNDYTYDANGNMTTDQNKGITGTITYNYLNLPELVTRGTGNTIRYIYDATGRKLAQVASYNSAQKQTDYVGEYQYENDVLQNIMHEEGRIVVSTTQNQYTNGGDNTANITAANSTLALVTQNGTQTYIKATSSGITARTGITFTTLNVTAGERYIVRAKGYRDKGTSTTSNPVYLSIKASGVDQGWPGATLASSVDTEAWTEQAVTVPAGATTLLVGMAWNTTVTTGEVFFVNDFEVNKLSATVPEYQYNLKDHLGNVRVTFTTKDETVSDVATYEAANINVEQSKFLRYPTAKRINATIFDRTNGAAIGYSERLNGSTNEKYGLAKSLSVMPGDVINAEVYAKYVDPVTSNWTGALTTLMAQIAANTAGVVVDGSGYSTSTSTFPSTYGGLQSKTDNGAPKAYLNWLIFDRNYVFQTGGFKQITTAGKEAGSDVAHELVASPSITITQPGYVYIYLSNESATTVEAYFDDFKVTQTKSPVIQSDDYYPFGLTFNSYSRENSTPNQYQYNGKEKQDELGLDWLDYGARMYMPEIGRFSKQDRYSFKYYDLSPYSYGANNPINFVDINGDSLQYVGSLQQVAFLLLQSAESCGCKVSSKVKGTDENGNVTLNVTGFESVDDDFSLQQSDLKTIIESEHVYTEKFVETKKGFADDVELNGGAMYDPKTRTTSYADHWMRGGWGEDMRSGAPGYDYAVNEAASSGDYVAFKIMSLFTTPENNPYAKQVRRLIPFSEAMAHERRHAVDHENNNLLGGSYADVENNAIRPLNRWHEKKGIPKRPLKE